MNLRNIKVWIYSIALLTVVSCRPEIDLPQQSAGSADFTKYIAIGNSLTAGYADNGLYLEGQKVAYPNLIAEQMKAVGGGNFVSPFFTEAQANGSGYVRLTGFNPDGSPIITSITDKLAYRSSTPKLLTKYTDEIQNLGVPNMSIAFSTQNIMSSTLGNMYFERLVPDANAGTINYQQFATTKNHTFFSFWLGNIDALGWATSGGNAEGDITRQLTPVNAFTGLLNQFINSLTSNGRKGVIATIPDVSAIPFFNTVTVAAINKALEANQVKLYIQPANGLPRLATNEDLIVLNFDRSKLGVGGYGVSPLNPMENKYVLDKDEVATVQQAIKSYNIAIKQVAEVKDLAFVDTYAILNEIKKGKNFDGVEVSSEFIRGNAFSLDGVHLTPIGNAIVANAFIDAINAKYNSTIPKISVANYVGVKFP